MLIILTPVPAATSLILFLEGDVLTVNGEEFDLTKPLPGKGPVRLDQEMAGDTLMAALIVEYGQDGALATRIGDTSHELSIVPRPPEALEAAPDAEPDPVLSEADILAGQRDQMVCERWQLRTVLGRDRWTRFIAYASSPDAPWGLLVIAEDIQTFQRISESIDTLAWVLGLSYEEVDRIYLAAMALQP